MVVAEGVETAMGGAEMAVVALGLAELMERAVAGLCCRVHHHPSHALLSTETVEHSGRVSA